MLSVTIYELDVGSEEWAHGPVDMKRWVAVLDEPHLGRLLGRAGSRQGALDDLMAAIQTKMREHKILSLEYIQLPVHLKQEPLPPRTTRYERSPVI
jgi:hypothetical protein